jgi:hypothetical protein
LDENKLPKKNTASLFDVRKEVGLEINEEKTVQMFWNYNNKFTKYLRAD